MGRNESRHSLLVLSDGIGFAWIGDINQVVRPTGLLSRRGLGGANIKIAVDLARIGTNEQQVVALS